MKQGLRHSFRWVKRSAAIVLSLALVLGFMPQMTVWAGGTDPETVTVNGTGIGEFKIVHLSTAAETELRPYVKGFDSFSLGAAAAAELQGLIEDATGETLDIEVVDSFDEATASKKIVLAFDTEIDTDAFSVTIDGDTITICGGTQHGVWYGLYDFLEEELGYRFFTRDLVVFGASYVESDKAVVDVEANSIDIRDRSWSETPGFDYRSISGAYFGDLAGVDGYDDVTHSYIASFHTDGIRANLASKQNGGDDDKWAIAYPQYGGMKGTVKSHAHAFCNLLAGTGLQGSNWNDQPCLTDQTTYDTLLEAVMDLIEWEYSETGFPIEHTSNFNIHQISLGWNDNVHYCTCENCQAKIEEMGSLTDVYIDYVNRIAAEVAKVYPDIQMMALMYNITTVPPVNVVPADNVDILYCSPGCNNHSLKDVMEDPDACLGCARPYDQSTSQSQNLSNLKGWLELTDNVYVWEYVDGFNNYIAQAPFYTYVYEEYSALAELGIKGIYSETRCDQSMCRYGFEDLRDYLLGKMMWDPDMSWEEYEKLAKEFISCFYCGEADSPAADKIYEYLLKWDAGGTDENPSCWMNNYSSIKATNNLEYWGENGDEILKLLQDALEMIEGDTKRVEYLYITCRYLTLAGQYHDRYTLGSDASKKIYVREYTALHEMALEVLPSVWVDQYYCRLFPDLTSKDTIYTTRDGICIDYCPTAWYSARDGFFDVDPYYYQLLFMMNDGTDAVFEEQRISNFWATEIGKTPVRPGYVFKGWFLDAEGTEPMVFEFLGTKITGANTEDGVFKIYASWEACTEHDWDEGVVTKEPTTKEEGVKTFTCKKCGETRTEVIEKLPYNPPTGDNTNLWAISLLMLTAGAGLVLLTLRKKQEN